MKKDKSKKEKFDFKKEFIHFVEFSSVSVVGTLLQLVLFYFLIKFSNRMFPENHDLADGLTTAFCYFLCHIGQYTVNKFFVFKTGKNGFSETAKYFTITFIKLIIASFLVPYLFNILEPSLLKLFTNWELESETVLKLTSFTKTVINAFVQLVLFCMAYFFQKVWVFKPMYEENKPEVTDETENSENNETESEETTNE